VLNVFADDADAECVIHCLVEEIPVEMNDVRVVLSFEKLNCLFL